MAGDKFDDSGNPFSNILKTGSDLVKASIGLAPLGAAGYYGYTKITANRSLNPLAAGGLTQKGGHLKRTGLALGQKLAAHATTTEAAKQKAVEKTLDALMETDALKKMLNSASSVNAAVAALLNAFDDPSLNLAENVISSYRNELMTIADKSIDETGVEDLLRSTIKIVTDSLSTEGKIRWETDFNEYQKISKQIVRPFEIPGSGQIYQPIPASTLAKNSVAERRYNAILENLGGNQFKSNVEVVKINTLHGEQQTYARIYSSNNPQTRRFVGELPLDPGTKTPSIRMGKELSSSVHPISKYFLDGEVAERLMKGGASWDEVLKGAKKELPDIWAEELFRSIEVVDGKIKFKEHSGKNKFGETRRQLVAHDPWTLSIGEVFSDSQPGLRRHQQQAIEQQTNTATVFFSKSVKDKRAKKVVSKLQAMTGVQGGVSPDSAFGHFLDKSAYGTVGLHEGSILQQIKSLIPATREDFAFTGREAQIGGRLDAFVKPEGVSHQKLGRSVWHSGPTATLLANHDMAFPNKLSNIDVANRITGGTNRAILFHIGKDTPFSQSFGGEGFAFGVGDETLFRPITKPLLLPEANEIMGSTFLKDLVAKVEAAGGAGTPVSFKRSDLAKYQFFAGEGGGGRQFITTDPMIKEFFLTYVHKPMENKAGVQVLGMDTRKTKMFKAFSLQIKSIVELMHEGPLWGMLPKPQRQLLKELGITEKQLVVTTADMFKKSPGFIGLQLKAGYGQVVGSLDELEKLTILAAKTTRYKDILGSSNLAQIAGATIESLGKQADRVIDPISDLQIGSLLSGVYQKGNDYVSPEGIESLVKSTFGKRFEGILEVMKGDWTLSGSTLFAGTAQETYGKSVVGIEPRTIPHLEYRLRRMGMKTEDVNDILFDIFQRKKGVVQNVRAAIGLQGMLRGIHGLEGISDFLFDAKHEIPTLTLENLSELNTETLRETLRKYDNGFVLDLTQGAQKASHFAVSEAATEVLGQGQLPIPGQKVFDALRGTVIKTTEGNVSIENRYQNLVEHLIKNLADISNSPERAREKATSFLTTFKENINELSSQISDTVVRGKVIGTSSNVAKPYDLLSGYGFGSKKQWDMAIQLNKQAKNLGVDAVFQNTFSFMNTLKSFMGSKQDTVANVAEGAEEFFVGQYLRGGETPGYMGSTGRDPTVSPGNLDFALHFRDVKEAFPPDYISPMLKEETNKQLYDFLTVQKTKPDNQNWIQTSGRAMGKDWPGTPQTWKELSELPEDIRHSFFKNFVSTLDEFMGEGEGFVSHVVDMEPVTIEGYDKPQMINMGPATAKMGDYDADAYHTMMFSKARQQKIRETLQAPEAQVYKQARRDYTILTDVFTRETKKSLETFRTEHLRKIAGGGTVTKEAMRDARVAWDRNVEKISQDFLKEVGAKTGVGPLDVEFKTLVQAMEDMPIPNEAAGRRFDATMAFVKVVEEHSTIKGKKAPMLLPFAQQLTAGVQALLAGDSSVLRDVFERNILKGSRMLTPEGLKVDGMKERVKFSDIMDTFE